MSFTTRGTAERHCFGKTPMQTFRDAKKIAFKKSNQLMYNNNLSDSHKLSDSQVNL